MPNAKQGGRAPVSVIFSSISRSCWPMPGAWTAMIVPPPSANSRSWMVPSFPWKVRVAIQISFMRCGFRRPMRRNFLPCWKLQLPPAGGKCWRVNSPRQPGLKFLKFGAVPGKNSVVIWLGRLCGEAPLPPSPGMIWRAILNCWPSLRPCWRGSRGVRNRSCDLPVAFSPAIRICEFQIDPARPQNICKIFKILVACNHAPVLYVF